ncbi:DUF2752 domain-containing protein [Nocardioides marmotae]|uniref:DUF2752 domain-containing protein n=1 Tax=Nocardioides marmotae TaxID=2663857 RepID=A0A6I3JBV8_9ACTN|nr:DUF2752 domain-containing protein [Nocardioides marmotae]MCR6032001.1 DUF2752 domain-containing protein [Gordonia jinghuaiqii]MBC9732057.1 DUF2752 domain-containing protein [Nocardioides marmotae]MTB83178.1 DUF2752 domain-containing protein [Nocardioides marmotae]MTB95642.1 DUF2752 domain-containing protein [Nocardioides marmotae]QKE01056.1 DUF2752 domain-containing protein [Nocardioides marmotae]
MTRGRRLLAPAVTLGGLAAATLALHLRDPHERGSWGSCPSAALGFWCPGCGGLRAVNDLTNGRFADAASSNLLLIGLLPVLAALYLWWVARRWRGETREPDQRFVVGGTVTLCVVAVVFAVLRNLPAGAWLAP